MSIASFISGDVGPGVTIPLLITRGLSIGEAVVVVETTTAEGGGSSKNKRKYPRWVLVGDARAQVNSPDEERQLLAAMLERAQAQVVQADTPVEAKQAKSRAIRIAKRIEKVDDREAQWLQRLREMDEEILLLVD